MEPVDSFKIHAAVVNCIDGRVQAPVREFLQDRFRVDYIDVITQPGADKALADGTDASAVESVLARLGVSVRANNAEKIAVVGHHDCRANPVDEATHHEQTLRAVAFLSSKYPTLEVIGLWVDENWEVRELVGDDA